MKITGKNKVTLPNKYIYTIDFKTLEEIVNGYIDYVTNPQNIYRQELSDINMFTGEEIYNDGRGIIDMPLSSHRNYIGEDVIDVENLPKPQQLQTKYIFMVLFHNLYSRLINTEPHSDDAWFLLSSEAFKKVDDYYNHKLNYLRLINILSVQQYDETRFYYTINNPNEFHLYNCSNQEVLRKINQIEQHFEDIDTKKIKEVEKRLPKDFFNTYNNSLKYLRLEDEEGARVLANSQIPKRCKEKNIPKLYYNHIIDILKEGKYKRVKPDYNGRFYHIGTMMPHDIKQFTNIQLSIDCKNSHLLLFNNLLLSYYLQPSLINIHNNYNLDININTFNLYYSILNYLFNNFYLYNFFYYFVDKLCNHLIHKHIENDKITKVKSIPQDVWEYMYDASHGKVWDYFIDLFRDDEDLQAFDNDGDRRTYVKQTMFGNVFYDARTRVYKDNPNSKWAIAFRNKYPNVYRIISHFKKELRMQCEKENLLKKKIKNNKKKMVPEVQLSHLMMRLESQIFTSILIRLFKKTRTGLRVMGIHDAIVVVQGLDKFPEEKIREIMMEEYKRFGLVPTLSVDKYRC